MKQKMTNKAAANRLKSKDFDLFASDLPSVIKLLLIDHKAMRKLMQDMQSQRASTASVKKHFGVLKALVKSHMAAEETSLLNHLKSHPKFSDEATESYEEHRMHELIFRGIAQINSPSRKAVQMKIYCEMLEHHLKEEEKDLFPRYKTYFSLSTRKEASKTFMKKRLKTSKRDRAVGVLAE